MDFEIEPLALCARARQRANGILMTMAKIRENDPSCMIDMKATDLCRTCLNRQYISLVFFIFFMDPYTLTTGLILLRCTNITLYQFAFSIIHSADVILIAFTASQPLCNYFSIIIAHLESQPFHRLLSKYIYSYKTSDKA